MMAIALHTYFYKTAQGYEITSTVENKFDCDELPIDTWISETHQISYHWTTEQVNG